MSERPTLDSELPFHLDEEFIAREKRVLIRRACREDIDKRLEWGKHTDPLFWQWNAGPMSSLERDTWFYTKLNRPDYLLFAIEDRESGLMIGFLSLRDLHPSIGQATLGISIDPNFINRGYGTEILQGFFGYFFRRMAYSELVLDVAAYNVRAYRCYEKCGFIRVYQGWSTTAADGIPRQVLTDPEFMDIRHLFRETNGRFEGLLYHMLLRRAAWEKNHAG